MFEQTLQEIDSLAGEAAIDACWRQWQALGAMASVAGRPRGRAIVDPEALLLLSLDLRPRERRLEAMIGWWATVGAHLTSVQRLRTLSEGFADRACQGIADFASMAVNAGHKRWRKQARGSRARPPERLKGPDELALMDPTTLMARLRAGFGVSAKADLLTFLLGLDGARASVKAIARAIGYTTTTVRGAADDMSVARLIQRTADRPVEYFVFTRPWAELLELEPRAIERVHEPGRVAPPAWRYWAPLFAFLSRTLAWAQRQATDEAKSYLAASRARDLVEACRDAFDLNGIEIPDPASYPGDEYLQGLNATVTAVADWLETNV